MKIFCRHYIFKYKSVVVAKQLLPVCDLKFEVKKKKKKSALNIKYEGDTFDLHFG